MHGPRRLLLLAAFLLLTPPCVAVAQAPRAPHLAVLATVPQPPRATLGRSATFFIRYRLDAAEPLLVSIEAYGGGQRLSTGNSGLTAIPAGGGTGVSFFFLLSGHRQTVDEVHLVATTTGKPQHRWVFPISVALTFDPAVTAAPPPLPGWVKTWQRERQTKTRAQQDARHSSGSAGALLGLTLLVGALVLALPLASIALPIWAIRRWQGRWRLLACLPLAVIALKLLSLGVGVARDPTSHNLWPLEIALWEAPALGFLALVWLARRGAMRRHADGPGA